jgi:hypothetical protein
MHINRFFSIELGQAIANTIHFQTLKTNDGNRKRIKKELLRVDSWFLYKGGG